MGLIKTALHEHLGTGIYKGSFDEVIDLAKKRLGKGGIFSVVSIGDDRLPSDRRYETFVDSNSIKYGKVDLGGRATYVEGAEVTVVNGLEMELKEGHLLATGLERDTEVETGSDVHVKQALVRLNYLKALSFYVHPWFLGGMGEFLAAEFEKRDDFCFVNAIGYEVYNQEANLLPGSNKLASASFREIQTYFPFLAPLSSNDGHTLYEFGRVTTDIPDPSFKAEAEDGNAKFVNALGKSFSEVEPREIMNQRIGLRKRVVGVVGAIQHGIDLKFVHPGRLNDEQQN
jgi:hypothetical protein